MFVLRLTVKYHIVLIFCVLNTQLVSLCLLDQNKENDNELLIAFHDENDLVKRMNTVHHREALLIIQTTFHVTLDEWLSINPNN